MTREFVNPNLHVVLIHLPMGLLLVGTLIELFSFLGWRRGGFRLAGRWMILLGILSSIPTALSGVYALNEVTRKDLPREYQAAPWKDVLQHSPLVTRGGGEAWQHMSDHAWIQSISTGVLVLLVLVWLSSSDVWRARLHVPLTLVLLLGVIVMSRGAWDSGEGVYAHGVAVDSPESAREGAAPATGTAARAGEDERKLQGWPRDPAFYLPPMEGHMILAGFTVAMAVVALGLAIHNAHAPAAEVDGMDDIALALGSTAAEDDAFLPDEQRAVRARARTSHYHSLPAARFWLLTVLLGLITVAFGWWILSRPENLDTWNPRRLAQEVFDPSAAKKLDINRRSVHVMTGSSIVLIALLMALITRVAPRQKALILLLGLLLVVAVSIQVWLGILLTFDTANGPLRAFN